MQDPVYLDFNATTPVDPAVVESMMPYLVQHFGNASSAHPYGYRAHEAMERARARVAGLVGAKPSNIVFTGGGSETNNLALKGTVFPALRRQPHIIASAVEHPAVLNTLAYLRRRFDVEYCLLPVDEFGMVSPESVRAALRPNTVIVTVMHANNEVGTIQPIREIGAITREAGVLFHVDAAQSAGKTQIDVEGDRIDMLSLAGHKLYAPKGIGALYLRDGVVLDPLVHGSGQERGLRAGTENVAGMVALGEACAIASADLNAEIPRLRDLRDHLHALLATAIPRLALNGHPECRLPNTLNVSFPGVTGQALLAMAPEVAASTGSACHSAQPDPSPVLLAMGHPPERALGAVRLSVGRMSSREQVERAAAALITAYHSLVPAPVKSPH